MSFRYKWVISRCARFIITRGIIEKWIACCYVLPYSDDVFVKTSVPKYLSSLL